MTPFGTYLHSQIATIHAQHHGWGSSCVGAPILRLSGVRPAQGLTVVCRRPAQPLRHAPDAHRTDGDTQPKPARRAASGYGATAVKAANIYGRYSISTSRSSNKKRGGSSAKTGRAGGISGSGPLDALLATGHKCEGPQRMGPPRRRNDRRAFPQRRRESAREPGSASSGRWKRAKSRRARRRSWTACGPESLCLSSDNTIYYEKREQGLRKMF